jgi:hypothetical protein
MFLTRGCGNSERHFVAGHLALISGGRGKLEEKSLAAVGLSKRTDCVQINTIMKR